MRTSLGLKSGIILLEIILCLFCAELTFARPVENDDSGYLSNHSYNLATNRSPTNVSYVQIADQDAPEKVFGLNLSFRTRGNRISDDNVKASTSATSIDVEFEWNVTKWLKAQFIGGYQFAAGNSAVIYGTESSPESGPGFDEASFTTTAIPSLQFSAGIVSTEFNPMNSAFSGGGFAGMREVYEIKKGSFVGSIKGFQVAPNGSGSTNRALDDEKNPFLTIGNLNLGFKQDRFEMMLGYTKYDFYGMTSASADDSRYLGNTVSGEGNNVVFYKYKFRGQEMSAHSQMTLRLDDKLGFDGSFSRNDEAPDKRNSGWIAKGYYEYNFGRYSIRPSVTRFRFESDLMPALFAQGGYGYLNRDGYAGEIRGALKKYKLEGYIRYLDAKEIERKAAQSDRVTFTLGMEVKYEIL